MRSLRLQHAVALTLVLSDYRSPRPEGWALEGFVLGKRWQFRGPRDLYARDIA
jgi:hypothetical protein